MTKSEVLTIFAKDGGFLRPDDVLERLSTSLDRRSLYSYLLRLNRQGLLEQKQTNFNRRVVYRLTERGRERLRYFQGTQ